MNIRDLKNDLQATLDFLEARFNDSDIVEVVGNTYFLASNHFLSTKHGFIDLDNPLGSEDDDE